MSMVIFSAPRANDGVDVIELKNILSIDRREPTDAPPYIKITFLEASDTSLLWALAARKAAGSLSVGNHPSLNQTFRLTTSSFHSGGIQDATFEEV